MSNVDHSPSDSEDIVELDSHRPRGNPANAGRPDRVAKRRKDGNPAKDWCVTARSIPDFVEAKQLPDDLSYCIGQQERGEGGFLHWQIFVQCSRKLRFTQVQGLLGDSTAHCEVRKGSPEQAAAYCRKPESAVPGTQFELGELKGLKANHVDALKAALDGGMGVADIAREHFAAWVRCEKAVDRYIQLRDQNRTSNWDPPVVHCFWGDTGTGKSRKAFGIIDGQFGGVSYRKPAGAWWDGYSAQKCVLFDDYDGDVPIGQLLQLLDGRGHGVLLPIKGSHIQCVAKFFIFTSNKHPSAWYPHATDAQKAALVRRLTTVEAFFEGQQEAEEQMLKNAVDRLA